MKNYGNICNPKVKLLLKIIYILFVPSILIIGIMFFESIFIYTNENNNDILTQKEEVMNENIINEDEEIMPDGIYLYYVDGSYMTVGIMTTGRVSGTNRRAGRATFYGVTEFGDVSSSYETIFMEDTGGTSFTCIGRNYSLKYEDDGKLSVVRTAEYEDLGTILSFEGNYIYLYPFDENSSTVRGEQDCDQCNYAPD